tara:strand:- start:283 stop:525 length:243 start_codon:yes stop_codon:yes gene_type:complete
MKYTLNKIINYNNNQGFMFSKDYNSLKELFSDIKHKKNNYNEFVIINNKTNRKRIIKSKLINSNKKDFLLFYNNNNIRKL